MDYVNLELLFHLQHWDRVLVFQWKSVLWACCGLCDFRHRIKELCWIVVRVPGYRTQLDRWWSNRGSGTQEGKPTVMHGPRDGWQGRPQGRQGWPKEELEQWWHEDVLVRIADGSRSTYRWQLWFSLFSCHPSKITSLSNTVFTLLTLYWSLSPESSTGNPKMTLKLL